MNIEVKVGDVTLATVVDEITEYDSEGYRAGREPVTIADLVADRIFAALKSDSGWPELRNQYMDVRREALRDQLAPIIEQVMAEPFRKTNSYGEPTGQPVTLRELVIAEVRNVMNSPADKYASPSKGSVIEQAVRKEVKALFDKEIGEAVATLQKEFAGQIGSLVATAVEQKLRGR